MTQAEVRYLTQPRDFERAARLFGEVWYGDGTVPYAGDLLHAVAFAGGYVAGAFVESDLIGASLGVLGRHRGDLVLHSHVTGVRPGFEHGGIGAALKRHQRTWAFDAGLDAIIWTFDPLVRRNAWFNLAKLGAAIIDYVESFYGDSDDAINGGDETDRAIVRWSTHAIADNTTRDGFVVVDADSTVAARPADAPVINIATPPDIVALRRDDTTGANRWRQATRRAFVDAFADGFSVTGITREGLYTMERR